MSYSEAMARAPPARPGCAVTSLTRSPPIQTSISCSRRPLRYWRPVRAGMVHLLCQGRSLPRRRLDLPVRSEAGELVRDAMDVGDHLPPQPLRRIRRKIQVERIGDAAVALRDRASDL